MHKMGTRVLNTLTSLVPSIVDLPYFPLTESEMAGLLIYPYGYMMYPHVHVMDLKDRDRIEVRPGGICGRYQMNSSPFYLLSAWTSNLEIKHALGGAYSLVHV